MTDANHDYENFRNFIQQRVAAIAYAKEAESREGTLQGVTVRLSPGNVALLDHFARQLDYSRQQLLGHMLNLSLDQMMAAWIQGMPKDQASKVYRELQDIRGEG